jgi:hypothetical protein
VDPAGGDFTYHWRACAAAEGVTSYASGDGSISGAPCQGEGAPAVIELGAGPTATLAVPADFIEANLAQLDAAYGANLPEGAAQALLSIAGLHIRVTLVVEGSGKRIESFKRVVVLPVSPLSVFNANPAPPAIVLGAYEDAATVPATADPPAVTGACLAASESLTSADGSRLYLTPVNLPETPDEYPVLDFTGGLQVREETTFFSWFSTVSGLAEEVTQSDRPECALDLRQLDAAQLYDHPTLGLTVPLWVVVRDARGGTAWCESFIPFAGP